MVLSENALFELLSPKKVFILKFCFVVIPFNIIVKLWLYLLKGEARYESTCFKFGNSWEIYCVL